MSRAERLLTLLECLRRRKRPVNGAELATELGVSLRTLYRDVASLQAQGARIDGEAGVGYRLLPGYTLPPLMFTEEELEALALGARWVAERTDPALGGAARDALAKIAEALTPELRRKLDTPLLLTGPGIPLADANEGGRLVSIRSAIRKERKLHIIYRDERDQESERVVWPLVLGFFDKVRLLAAWCELRQGFRNFRADRIVMLDMLDEAYPRPRETLLREWKASQSMRP